MSQHRNSGVSFMPPLGGGDASAKITRGSWSSLGVPSLRLADMPGVSFQSLVVGVGSSSAFTRPGNFNILVLFLP